MPGETEELELTEAQEAPEFEEDQQETEEQGDETVITFADEPEEGEEDVPLVKNLRAQIRERDRKLAQFRRSPPAADEDPEPAVPAFKRADDPAFEYDPDKHAEYAEKRDQAVADHAEWKTRQATRDSARQRAADEQGKQIEQQVRALGVSDYEVRSAQVRERLSDPQMAVLINATDNPGRLIYALGRSELRLDELAGIDNLAKFAARIGQLERDIKVTKRKAPPPESRVVGATATTAGRVDKHLEKLEREAEQTGNRSKVQAYKRSLKAKAA